MPTAYRIHTPYAVYGITVGENDTINDAPPALARWVTLSFIAFREYCEMAGWKIEPVLHARSTRFAHRGNLLYCFHYTDDVCVKITARDFETDETYNVKPNELPQSLRNLL